MVCSIASMCRGLTVTDGHLAEAGADGMFPAAEDVALEVFVGEMRDGVQKFCWTGAVRAGLNRITRCSAPKHEDSYTTIA
nr:MAG TPA: hypothetical protein [Caudoviricetes sp.]